MPGRLGRPVLFFILSGESETGGNRTFLRIGAPDMNMMGTQIIGKFASR